MMRSKLNVLTFVDDYEDDNDFRFHIITFGSFLTDTLMTMIIMMMTTTSTRRCIESKMMMSRRLPAAAQLLRGLSGI